MKSVEIIMLPVKDRQKAKEFYLKPGFQVIVEAPAAHGETWIQMGLPGCETTISLAGFQGIICETDNIENKIRELESKGIEVSKIEDAPWGKFAWMKDLDGTAWVCIKSSGAKYRRFDFGAVNCLQVRLDGFVQ